MTHTVTHIPTEEEGLMMLFVFIKDYLMAVEKFEPENIHAKFLLQRLDYHVNGYPDDNAITVFECV